MRNRRIYATAHTLSPINLFADGASVCPFIAILTTPKGEQQLHDRRHSTLYILRGNNEDVLRDAAFLYFLQQVLGGKVANLMVKRGRSCVQVRGPSQGQIYP